MIWGMTLEPGKFYTEIMGEEVQLSMAAIDSRKDLGDSPSTNFCQIVIHTEKGEYVLCTLIHGVVFQQNLDLKLMPREKVTFSVQGSSMVYLIGYTASCPRDGEIGMQEDSSAWDSFPEVAATNAEHLDQVSRLPDTLEAATPSQQLLPSQDVLPEIQTDHGICLSQTSTAQDAQEHHCVEQLALPESFQPNTSGPENQDPQAAVQPPAETTLQTQGPAMERAQTSPARNTRGARGRGNSTSANNQRTYPPLRQSQLLPKRNSSPAKGMGRPGPVHQSGATQQSESTVASQQNTPSPITSGVHLSSNGENSQNAPMLHPNSVKPLYSATTTNTTNSHPVARKFGQSKKTPYLYEEANFHCRFCPSSFPNQWGVDRHERIHTGQRPFSCTRCPKSFRQKCHLLTHLRVVHSLVKTFVCPVCSEQFTSRSSLRRHALMELHYNAL